MTFAPIPTTQTLSVTTQQMIDLGVVFKASTLYGIPIISQFLTNRP